MTKNNISSFEILDSKLLSVSFDVKKPFAPGAQIKVDSNLEMQHFYDEKDNILNLIMILNVTGEEIGMNIFIKYGGLFKFNNKPEPEEHLSKTAEITCASILFPFIREIIADLTRRTGFPPLLLNPVNFIEFYENNHPSI